MHIQQYTKPQNNRSLILFTNNTKIDLLEYSNEQLKLKHISRRYFLKTGFATQLVSRLSKQTSRPSVGSRSSTSRQPREEPSPRPVEPWLGDRRRVVAYPARPYALVWSSRGLSRVAIGRPGGRRGKGPTRPSSSTRPRPAISGQVLIVLAHHRFTQESYLLPQYSSALAMRVVLTVPVVALMGGSSGCFLFQGVWSSWTTPCDVLDCMSLPNDSI